MGDEDEGDADLALDALQLDLHLLAQLEVEGAERLVEQEHARVVDERARQRDPLLLPAGQLVRLAPLEAGQLDKIAAWRDTCRWISSSAVFLRRRPNAMFS